MQCPVDYDPHATSSLWTGCLERWQPDIELREYLRREMGAGATGIATETSSAHLGNGGNGKSKFFQAIQHVLGPYAVVPHKSLLIKSRHEQHATVTASMFRVRLGVCSETPQDAWLDESQIKNLTGGDRLRTRRMHQDEWSFNPTHTLVMFSNHKPRVGGTDEGIWRRIRLIPWDVEIPKEEMDDRLSEKLADEAPAILAWVVDGARRYLADGRLWAPERVDAATAEYRQTQDTVGRFIAEVLELDAHSSERASELVEAHERWVNMTGERLSWVKVTERLKALGADSEHTRNGALWLGVSLKR